MMKSDTDILTAAGKELGWTQIHLNNAPHHAYQGLVGTRDGSHFEPLPDWLTSLDAHFAPGSTIEYMVKRGYGFKLLRLHNADWKAVFIDADPVKWNFEVSDPDPARAVTLAFLKWRQPQENWE